MGSGTTQATQGVTSAAAGTTAGSMTATAGPDTTADGSTTGGCTDHAQCSDQVCIEGVCTSVQSCRQLEQLDVRQTLPSGVYPLDPDGEGGIPPFEAFCELERMGGGWTLVLKAMGESPTFAWESPQWTDEAPYRPQFPDLDRSEAKLASYVYTPVTELLVGMESPIGAGSDPLDLNWLTVPVAGDSLHALISPGDHVATNVGRDAWKSLIEDSSLQLSCNREGLNASADQLTHTAVRIGIIANEQIHCETPDSRLGIGGRASLRPAACGVEPHPNGNFAGCNPDEGNASLPAFAVVLVR